MKIVRTLPDYPSDMKLPLPPVSNPANVARASCETQQDGATRRRWLLDALGASGALAGASFLSPTKAHAANLSKVPSQKEIFIDPATEYQVTRWTEDTAESHLPTDPNRALTDGDGTLLYASNRGGSWQPYILNLKRGESIQTGVATDLQPRSLALLRDGKDVIFLDGDSLVRNEIRRGRTREIYRSADGWRATGNLILAHDDRTAAVVEQKDSITRIVFVDPGSGKAKPVLQADGGELLPLGFHQRFGLLLLDSRHKPSLVGASSAPSLPQFPEGEVLKARWDSTGRILMYLIHTKGEREHYQLMEYDLDAGEHRLIANTSKFATFSANSDASVFVGASSSIAQPLLLLLLRVTRREFSLMEHHSTIPAAVNPFFSRDSQTLYFESDRLGKSCVFSINIKGLVEKT